MPLVHHSTGVPLVHIVNAHNFGSSYPYSHFGGFSNDSIYETAAKVISNDFLKSGSYLVDIFQRLVQFPTYEVLLLVFHS